MKDKSKIEDCGICEHCNSPLKEIYHYDGRPTKTPSTVEYICKCPKADPRNYSSDKARLNAIDDSIDKK